MKGRETAVGLKPQPTPSPDPTSCAPAPPVVLNWLVTVDSDAREAFQVPSRLLDRAVADGLIDISGREALAHRILRLLDDGYLAGVTTRGFGQTDGQVLAETLELELTMKAYREASPATNAPEQSAPRWASDEGEVRDLFISHASEDKAEIARPLAIALQRRGYSVWFDEFELVVGSRLSASIDKGLATSRFGVVILSSAFMSKSWPKRELAGLVARETGTGEDLILPVWHGVTPQDVLALSPPLADVFAVDSERGVDAVVDAIARALSSPDLASGGLV